ncbi:MAG: hypothetical protein ACRD0F_02035 [Acidimicrobiales bacterium]
MSVPTTLLPPSIKLPTGVEVAKDGDSLVLTLLEPALTFARDSADPADPGAARELASLVARAVQAGSPVVRVEVLGYASADGPSEAYDRTLSAARASTVCALLRSEGVTVAENDCRGEGRAGSGPESRRVDVRLVTQ